MTTQYEREAQQLDDDLAAGHISPQEHMEQMRDLDRDMRTELEQEAQDAYDNVMYRGY